MSKVSVSVTRAQAVEERQNLLRWLTKERVVSIVQDISETNAWGTIQTDFQYALSGTRSVDCIITYSAINKIFIKAKPTTQTFLDSVKQLNQERLLFSKDHPAYRNQIIERVILTYDRDQTDDELLAGQGVRVIRAYDFQPYKPIDGI